MSCDATSDPLNLKHPPQDERDIKILACDLIQSSGLLLQLPQVAMATAQIIFHRFYLVKSLVIHNYEVCSKQN